MLWVAIGVLIVDGSLSKNKFWGKTSAKTLAWKPPRCAYRYNTATGAVCTDKRREYLRLRGRNNGHTNLALLVLKALGENE